MVICGCLPVYPRWRGEHNNIHPILPYTAGLSPLARGTLIEIKPEQAPSRFIPAGAGNTKLTGRNCTSVAVYPRWRGEHDAKEIMMNRFGGLSPLARGTHEATSRFRTNLRFIPAGAGNTHEQTSAQNAVSVYPRWRGEHCVSHKLRSPTSGLSPLARGTRLHHPGGQPRYRFIPAGAGNTLRHDGGATG